jgi:ribose transport system permease protein
MYSDRTVFGRYAIALGTSEEAVRLSGIDTRPIKLAVFTLSGALAAVGGISYCAQLSAADPNAGNGFELAAIAAVVIGGTSLMGGRGSVINSLFGGSGNCGSGDRPSSSRSARIG